MIELKDLKIGSSYFDREDRKIEIVHITDKGVFYEGVSYTGLGGACLEYALRTFSLEKTPPKEKEECEVEFDNWVKYRDCDDDSYDYYEDEKNHWLDGYNWAMKKYKSTVV